jgi:iron(III) transport system substrate-binding protein
VLAGAEIDPVIADLGELRVDSLPLHEIYEHRERASELVDQVGFDQET